MVISHSPSGHEWVNVRRYGKALWIKVFYKCSPCTVDCMVYAASPPVYILFLCRHDETRSRGESSRPASSGGAHKKTKPRPLKRERATRPLAVLLTAVGAPVRGVSLSTLHRGAPVNNVGRAHLLSLPQIPVEQPSGAGPESRAGLGPAAG